MNSISCAVLVLLAFEPKHDKVDVWCYVVSLLIRFGTAFLLLRTNPSLLMSSSVQRTWVILCSGTEFSGCIIGTYCRSLLAEANKYPQKRSDAQKTETISRTVRRVHHVEAILSDYWSSFRPNCRRTRSNHKTCFTGWKSSFICSRTAARIDAALFHRGRIKCHYKECLFAGRKT